MEKNQSDSLIATLVKKIGKNRKFRMDRTFDLRVPGSKKLSMSSVSRLLLRLRSSAMAAASCASSLPTEPRSA